MTNLRLTLDRKDQEIVSIKKQVPLAYQDCTLLSIEVGDTLMRGSVTVPLYILEDMLRKLKDN